MAAENSETHSRLLEVATDLFRRNGFTATSVDDICGAAHVTKGAFFYYFKSKEAIAEACLAAWGRMGAEMIGNAPFHSIADPVERLRAGMRHLTGFFGQPGMLKSCLAGTTLHEVSESHPKLRSAAHACLAGGQSLFAKLIQGASNASGAKVDSQQLAALWMATLQGAYILTKGSGDDAVVRTSLEHVSQYILSLVAPNSKGPE